MKIPNAVADYVNIAGWQPMQEPVKLQSNPAKPVTFRPVRELSPLAQFVYKYDLVDFSYTSQNTQFAYNKDDKSVALRASSYTDVHLQVARYSLDFTFSAEALGLTAKDFEATGGKPIQLKFSYNQVETQIQSEKKLTISETIRKPKEILKDLTDALREVLKNGGDKSISVLLDDEAANSILGDPKIKKLFMELMSLVKLINSLKNTNDPRDNYAIVVSGKGKPIADYSEVTQIESKSTSIDISLTINPPGFKTDQVADVENEQNMISTPALTNQ